MKIKTTLLLLALILATAVPAQTPDYATLKASLSKKSLPLVNITVEIGNVSKPNYLPAKIEIADPWKRTDGNVETTFNCKVKYRGSSSLKYDKKSFTVKLLNDKGKSLDATVLGIRNDDSWILDAMAVDRLRMRNRLNFDIWNAMSGTPYETDNDNRNGTNGFFVELFINGEYHGLYCMTDKVNRKLLGVKKTDDKDKDNVKINGVMYKCDSWGSAASLKGYEEQDMNKESWNGWALDYPDDYPCAEAYTPLKNFIDYCATTSDDDFIAGIDKNFCLQNFIDYQVFLMSQGLRDNNMKNTFLSLVDKNESKRMMVTPWDLDCSLGGNYNGEYYNVLVDKGWLTGNYLYSRLWELNADNYRNKIANCWKKLCADGVLSKEGFNKRVDKYVEAFVESGAWERECNKWNNNPVELKRDIKEEAIYVKDWYSRNYDQLEKNVFYGLGTGIKDIVSNDGNRSKTEVFHNVMGQKVGTTYHGIVIKNGKKIICR